MLVPRHGPPNLAKSIEASLSNGNSKAAIATWRSQQDKIPSSPDLLRLAVQALLVESETTVVDEVIGHLMKHNCFNDNFAVSLCVSLY